MPMGVKHYLKDGKEHKGKLHKNAQGKLLTGTSGGGKRLYHYGELSKKAQVKARKSWKK
tara:strand:+ start:165 stop:341 length:177 start_codon:yes stop_codon:yes gene_type:complete